MKKGRNKIRKKQRFTNMNFWNDDTVFTNPQASTDIQNGDVVFVIGVLGNL